MPTLLSTAQSLLGISPRQLEVEGVPPEQKARCAMRFQSCVVFICGAFQVS